MPAQQGKVAIPTGLAAAHNEVKGREIKAGMSSLPPGLRGIAEFLECHIGEYQSGDNKGKPFFSMSAAIKQENSGAVGVLGLQTRNNFPLCATKTVTLKDNWGRISDELRKLLQVKTLEWGKTDAEVWANFQAVMKSLNESQLAGKKKIYTTFSTSAKKASKPEKKGTAWYVGPRGPYATEQEALDKDPYVKADPGVWENWNGGCDFSANGKPGALHPTQQDETGTEEPAPMEGSADSYVEGENQQDAGDAGTVAADTETMDVDELVTKARKKDEDAQTKLRELALEAGATQEQVDDENLTWQGLGDLVKELQAGSTEPAEGDGEPAAEEEAADEGFKVGEVYGYCPPHPKLKGKKLKKVNVKLTKVDNDKELVDCVTEDKAKTKFTKVPSGDLEDAL